MDVAVPYLAGESGRLRAEAGDENRRRLVGDGVETGVLHRVMLAVVAFGATLPEKAHHLDGFLQHLQAHVGRGPAVAQDVLVQVLAGADAEVKASFEHHGGGRRGLGHDGGVDAHGGAGHGGGNRQRGHLGEGPDHRPHKRAVTLLTDPRMVVVRDPERLKSGLLGHPGLFYLIVRPELLAGQKVPNLHHL